MDRKRGKVRQDGHKQQKQMEKTTTTTTTILRLSGCCPGQPGWSGTRRNIDPLTPIVVINHPCNQFTQYSFQTV